MQRIAHAGLGGKHIAVRAVRPACSHPSKRCAQHPAPHNVPAAVVPKSSRQLPPGAWVHLLAPALDLDPSEVPHTARSVERMLPDKLPQFAVKKQNSLAVSTPSGITTPWAGTPLQALAYHPFAMSDAERQQALEQCGADSSTEHCLSSDRTVAAVPLPPAHAVLRDGVRKSVAKRNRPVRVRVPAPSAAQAATSMGTNASAIGAGPGSHAVSESQWQQADHALIWPVQSGACQITPSEQPSAAFPVIWVPGMRQPAVSPRRKSTRRECNLRALLLRSRWLSRLLAPSDTCGRLAGSAPVAEGHTRGRHTRRHHHRSAQSSASPQLSANGAAHGAQSAQRARGRGMGGSASGDNGSPTFSEHIAEEAARLVEDVRTSFSFTSRPSTSAGVRGSQSLASSVHASASLRESQQLPDATRPASGSSLGASQALADSADEVGYLREFRQQKSSASQQAAEMRKQSARTALLRAASGRAGARSARASAALERSISARPAAGTHNMPDPAPTRLPSPPVAQRASALALRERNRKVGRIALQREFNELDALANGILSVPNLRRAMESVARPRQSAVLDAAEGEQRATFTQELQAIQEASSTDVMQAHPRFRNPETATNVNLDASYVTGSHTQHCAATSASAAATHRPRSAKNATLVLLGSPRRRLAARQAQAAAAQPSTPARQLHAEPSLQPALCQASSHVLAGAQTQSGSSQTMQQRAARAQLGPETVVHGAVKQAHATLHQGAANNAGHKSPAHVRRPVRTSSARPAEAMDTASAQRRGTSDAIVSASAAQPPGPHAPPPTAAVWASAAPRHSATMQRLMQTYGVQPVLGRGAAHAQSARTVQRSALNTDASLPTSAAQVSTQAALSSSTQAGLHDRYMHAGAATTGSASAKQSQSSAADGAAQLMSVRSLPDSPHAEAPAHTLLLGRSQSARMHSTAASKSTVAHAAPAVKHTILDSIVEEASAAHVPGHTSGQCATRAAQASAARAVQASTAAQGVSAAEAQRSEGSKRKVESMRAIHAKLKDLGR